METFDTNKREEKKNIARQLINQRKELEGASSDEELGWGEYIMDVAAAIPRGIESGVKDAYNLVDDATSWVAKKVTGNEEADILPDYEENFLGESKTGVGKVVQSVSEWVSVFLPVAGQVGAIAKGTSVISKLGKAGKAAQATAKVAGKWGLGTGAVADFVVQQQNDGTISNMINDAGFDNALTNYLAVDEDDSLLEAKVKATLEGAILGGAIVGATTKLVAPLFKSLKQKKALNKALAAGSSKAEVDAILNEKVLSKNETEVVEKFIASREATEVKAKELLKDADIGETKSIMEDFGAEVSTDDVLEVAKLNYKNVVEVNDELTKSFTAIKQADAYDHKGLTDLLDNVVKLKEITSYQGKSLQALKGQAKAQAAIKDSKALNTIKESVAKLKAKAPEELKVFNEMVTGLDTPKELRSFLNQTLTKTEPGMLKKSMHIVQEFWRNALLSGTATHVLNFGSNAFRLGFDKFSTTLKGLFKGDTLMMKQGAVEFRALFTNALESSKLAFRVAKTNFTKARPTGIIDKSSSAFIDTASNTRYLRKWSKEYTADNAFGTAAEYIGSVVNIPTTMLSATDEMFKQLAVRSKIEGKFFMEGSEKGLKHVELETFIKQNVDKVMMDTGEIVNKEALFKKGLTDAKAKGIDTVKGRMEFANKYVASTDSSMAEGMKDELIDYAKQMTYQSELKGISKNVQKFVNEYPLALGWFLPFVKTPMNVLTTGIKEFTPIQSFIDIAKGSLFSADAAIKAEAQARFAVTTATTGAVLGAINNGAVTGAGPTNPKVRANLMASGWQPYSIKFGSKYISYRRLDPIATPIGLLADMYESYNEGLVDNADGKKLLNAALVSVFSNLANKTYLQGITNFVKLASSAGDPEGNSGTYFISQFLGSFVPSVVANSGGMISGVDPVVQVRGIFDGMKARLGFDENLEIKRNILGEEISSIEGTSAMYKSTIPAKVTTAGKDSVSAELAKTGLRMGQPSVKMGGVDLREIPVKDGKSAYTLFMDLIRDTKINGKNLRTSLQSKIKSSRYKRLPEEATTEDIESARASMLKTVISRYRLKAKKNLIKMLPELDNKIKLKRDLRRQVRRGKSTVRNAIESLIQKQ